MSGLSLSREPGRSPVPRWKRSRVTSWREDVNATRRARSSKAASRVDRVSAESPRGESRIARSASTSCIAVVRREPRLRGKSWRKSVSSAPHRRLKIPIGVSGTPNLPKLRFSSRRWEKTSFPVARSGRSKRAPPSRPQRGAAIQKSRSR